MLPHVALHPVGVNVALSGGYGITGNRSAQVGHMNTGGHFLALAAQRPLVCSTHSSTFHFGALRKRRLSDLQHGPQQTVSLIYEWVVFEFFA